MKGTTTHNSIEPNAATALPLERDVADFAGQLAGAMIGAASLATASLGDRLGLYAAMAGKPPVTSGELADATGFDERLLREWLAQQATAGFLRYEAPTQSFSLPPAHAAVLVDGVSPASMIGDITMAATLFLDTEAVAGAFGSGHGLDWALHDPLVFEATERFWGARYRAGLEGWLALLPELDAALRTGATVADVGCGRGYPAVLLAGMYPGARITGFDAHEPSIQLARERANAAGLAARVDFTLSDAAGYPGTGYDLITFFDAFHDLGDPLGAAIHARDALADGGTLLLIEPYSAGSLAQNLAQNPAAAFGYAASIFLCTPNSLSQPVGLALGAMSGEQTLRGILAQAGFTAVEKVAETPFNLVLAAQRRHSDH